MLDSNFTQMLLFCLKFLSNFAQSWLKFDFHFIPILLKFRSDSAKISLKFCSNLTPISLEFSSNLTLISLPFRSNSALIPLKFCSNVSIVLYNSESTPNQTASKRVLWVISGSRQGAQYCTNQPLYFPNVWELLDETKKKSAPHT